MAARPRPGYKRAGVHTTQPRQHPLVPRSGAPARSVLSFLSAAYGMLAASPSHLSMCGAGATAALDAAAAARSATEGSCTLADATGTSATDQQHADRRGSHAEASAGPGADTAPSSGAGARHVPKSTADGYFTDFKLCLSSPELVELLVKHGHQRPFFMDATFGTNNLKARPPSPFHKNIT